MKVNETLDTVLGLAILIGSICFVAFVVPHLSSWIH